MPRPTPVHRRLTQENMRALEDPTSAEYTTRRWRHTRTKLLRTLMSFALVVIVVQMCSIASHSDAEQQAAEQSPAADTATVARRPAA